MLNILELKVGFLYEQISDTAGDPRVFYVYAEEEGAEFPMKVMHKNGTENAWAKKINLYEDDAVLIGEGNFEDYPEYFL